MRTILHKGGYTFGNSNPGGRKANGVAVADVIHLPTKAPQAKTVRKGTSRLPRLKKQF